LLNEQLLPFGIVPILRIHYNIPMRDPDISRYIQYNPDTGSFKWLVSGNGRRVGDSAGTYGTHGYWWITHKKVLYPAAHIAWYLTYGEWPKGMIDHIDRNPSNNRISNLRDISERMNVLHRQGWSKNGLPRGVRLERGRYRVVVSLFYKTKHIGFFDTLEEATVVAERAYKKQWELAERRELVERLDRTAKKALLDELKREALGL
jgi:hypothetical protein